MSRLRSAYRSGNSYFINGSRRSSGKYDALYLPEKTATQDPTHVVILGERQTDRPLTERTLITDVRKADGSTYSGFAEFDAALADFFGKASVGGGNISPDHIFANAAARDAYFDAPDPHLTELRTGLEIVLDDDGSGNRVIQRWTGETMPTSYPATPEDFWFTEGTDSITSAQVKTLYEANLNTNALTDDKLAVLDELSIDPSGDIRSDVSFIFPPGSVIVGDSVIESGGRMISARSASTGNQGAFLIQLFNGTQYSKATVYDASQVAITFDIQTTLSNVSSGTSLTQVRQVVQNDVQFQKVRFMPVGGAITQNFNFSVRLSQNGEPIYDETVTPSDSNLADIGGGVFELTLLNPSQFDAGFNAYIDITGLDLLGGNGFDGSDTVRFGDSSKSNFFPWIQSVSIPIFRQDIATENYVDNLIGGGLSIHNFNINIPSRVNLNTNLNQSYNVTFDVTRYDRLTSLTVNDGTNNVGTLTLPTMDGQQTQSVTLSGLTTDTQKTIRLRLRPNGDATKDSNIQNIEVRDLAPHEPMYWRVDADSNANTFSEVGAESQEAYTGAITIPTFTGSRYLKIAYPSTVADPTSIVIDGVEQIGAFTNAGAAVQINSENYDVVVSNNALDGAIVSGLSLTINR